MSRLTRRRLASVIAGSFVATTLYAPRVGGQARPKLVVIGGGAGGATIARRVAVDSAGAIEVTLVEPNRTYVTCFFSNLYIGGLRSLASLTHGYAGVAATGVRLVHTTATAIDRDARHIVLADGPRIPYDRLALAPGVDLRFDSVPGYSHSAADIMPHAWKAGSQTELLAAKLSAINDGDTIVIIPPPNPARCPPAPYERASMFAHVLKGKNHKKSRIVILDPKSSFPEQTLFMTAWEQHYPGMIEWQDPGIHGGIQHVDPTSGEIVTDLGRYTAALANVIPAQEAGMIARDAGLADASGYCPVDPATMASRVDANIFVLGDAAIASEMPKSAVAARGHAKVAAEAVRAALVGTPWPRATYDNACWSLIAPEDAITTGGTYVPGEGRFRQTASFVSQPGDSTDVRRRNYRQALDWYNDMVSGMFG